MTRDDSKGRKGGSNHSMVCLQEGSTTFRQHPSSTGRCHSKLPIVHPGAIYPVRSRGECAPARSSPASAQAGHWQQTSPPCRPYLGSSSSFRGHSKTPRTRRMVAPVFVNFGVPWDGLLRPADRTGKSGEPADRNVCATREAAVRGRRLPGAWSRARRRGGGSDGRDHRRFLRGPRVPWLACQTRGPCRRWWRWPARARWPHRDWR